MNRDEDRSRVAGIFRGVRRQESVSVIGPTEPSGGTWVAANEFGGAFALLNWYAKSGPDLMSPISRGKLVRDVSFAQDFVEAGERIEQCSLDRFRPFRLLGFSGATGEVREWRWDGLALEMKDHPWRRACWASSGYDEPGAQASRKKCFEKHDWPGGEEDSAALREFHRGHRPGRGALSVCMHREEAATVSYTEFEVTDTIVRASYHAGAPCEENGFVSAELERKGLNHDT